MVILIEANFFGQNILFSSASQTKYRLKTHVGQKAKRKKMKHHIDSDFDEFLREGGILAEGKSL